MSNTVRQKKGFTTCVLLVATIACQDAIAPIFPSNSVPAAEHAGVAVADTNFVELSRLAIRGQKDARGGCRVGWTLTGKRGDSGIQRFVAWNFETCDFVLARGYLRIPPPLPKPLPGAQWIPDVDTKRTQAAYSSGRSAANTNSTASTMLGGQAGVYQEIYHLDPPDIRVTEQQYWFNWSWDNGCTNAGSGYQEVYWAYGSGWREPVTSYQPNGHDCYSTGLSATANFRNEVFCAPSGTVYVDYTQRTIGYDEGYFSIDWQGFATGAYCAEWLTGYHSYYSY